MFRELNRCFVEGDVMLADGYYCSYFLIADMLRRAVDVLFEQHGARTTDFRRGVGNLAMFASCERAAQAGSSPE